MTDLDWGNASLINMEIVARTPNRFSYVKPSIITAQNEILNFSQTPAYIATLSVISDQNQNNAILYENEIPLPQNQWVFNNSTEIEVISGFIPGAIYRLEYFSLIQLETAPIDLLIPASDEDIWFADYVAWNRQDVSVISSIGSQLLTFTAGLEASLDLISDQDKLTSVLTENTGITSRTVPKANWNYINASTVKISGAEFNSNALYTLQYNRQIPSIARIANIVSEVRSANSVFSLGSASYREFDIISNNLLDSTFRYHQIKLSLSNIVTLEDVRIHSAILKGLKLANAPGL